MKPSEAIKLVKPNPSLPDDIPNGTQFIRRGTKRCDICTVIDKHETFNRAGDLVKTAYVAEYEFMGQQMKCEAVRATIQLNFVK